MTSYNIYDSSHNDLDSSNDSSDVDSLNSTLTTNTDYSTSSTKPDDSTDLSTNSEHMTDLSPKPDDLSDKGLEWDIQLNNNLFFSNRTSSESMSSLDSCVSLQRGYAMVIGNSQYSDESGLTKLNVYSECLQMKALFERLNCEIRLASDLTVSKIQGTFCLFFISYGCL